MVFQGCKTRFSYDDFGICKFHLISILYMIWKMYQVHKLGLLHKSVARQRRTAHPKGAQMRSIARMRMPVATRKHAVRSGAWTYTVCGTTCRIAGVRSTEQSVAYTVCGTTCSIQRTCRKAGQIRENRTDPGKQSSSRKTGRFRENRAAEVWIWKRKSSVKPSAAKAAD